MQGASQLLSLFDKDEWVSVDIETTGLDILVDKVVLVGFAGNKGRAVIDARDPEIYAYILQFLRQHKWYAFNTAFDGSMLVRDMSKQWPEAPIWELCDSIVGDSMVLFKLLANDDDGQRSLERAIKDVLGWGKSHWNKDRIKDLMAKRGIGKHEMYKLIDSDPAEFMEYCSLDAEASWQLMNHLRMICEVAPFPAVLREHDILFANLLHLVIEQKIRGMFIDKELLLKYEATTQAKLEAALSAFYSYPPVKERVEFFNANVEAEYNKVKTSVSKVWATARDRPWEHPEVWTKGIRNKQSKWEMEHGSWFRIVEKALANRRTKGPDLFNHQSPAHLKWLFYDTQLVPFKVVRMPDPENEKPWMRRGLVEIQVNDTFSIDWEMTAKGALPIDKGVRLFFGEAGALYTKVMIYVKRLQFIKGLLKAVDEDSILRPDIRVHGTITGRCSGGVLQEVKEAGGDREKLSVLQLPKVKTFLESFKARPGNVIVQTDVASLENVIMAELSRDPLLLEIFASGKPHDSYLYMAVKYDVDGPKMAEVYKPDSPTVESVAAAKKMFKAKRTAWKSTELGKQFKMGVAKLRRKLATEGMFLSVQETRALSDAYDQAKAGTKEYDKQLELEWRQRGGWIMNAFDRPMAITDDRVKDCTSRKIQSSGHTILLIMLYYINKSRKEQGIKMWPFNADLHDATYWEAEEGHKDAAIKAFRDSYDSTNAWLKGLIPIKGVVEVGTNLAEVSECVDD